jgi:hypothetical protein
MTPRGPLLRIVRGRVLQGKEADFIERCRARVAVRARTPGLLSFMAGYRRVEGSDRFVLISSWASAGDAGRAAGPASRPLAVETFADVAEVGSVDEYDLLQPSAEGILDAPGAVLRLTSANIRPNRHDDLFRWLNERGRALRAEQLMLAWAMGERTASDQEQVVAATAWASPLVIEALAEPGRAGKSLFAAVDEFVTDTEVEHFHAIELRLPEGLIDLSSRRLIAARFNTRESAGGAQQALATSLQSTSETPISLAPLGSPGNAPDQAHLLVARVRMAEYAPAERIIVEHEGEILLTATEPAPREKGVGGVSGELSGMQPDTGGL